MLKRFVDTFARLDDLGWYYDSPIPADLSCSEQTDPSTQHWKPAQIATPRTALSDIQRDGRPLPSLFELLVTSYRWLEVDLGICCLLANYPANDLTPLASEMFRDPVLDNILLPAGFIRFATGPHGCYDPICFDLSRTRNEDCPIVRINHESVLIHDKLGDVATIFDSFRELVIVVINSAD